MVFGRPALQLGPFYRLELAVRELKRLRAFLPRCNACSGKRRLTCLLPLSHHPRKLRGRGSANTVHAPRTKRPRLLAGCLLLGQVGELLGLPAWVVGLSPYGHLSRLPAESFAFRPELGLTAIAAALLALAVWRYRERDVG